MLFLDGGVIPYISTTYANEFAPHHFSLFTKVAHSSGFEYNLGDCLIFSYLPEFGSYIP